MHPSPLLFIVTACFNAQATVADTQRSVDAALADTAVAGRVEHLVVDGLSTDRTAEIVAAHAALGAASSAAGTTGSTTR